MIATYAGSNWYLIMYLIISMSKKSLKIELSLNSSYLRVCVHRTSISRVYAARFYYFIILLSFTFREFLRLINKDVLFPHPAEEIDVDRRVRLIDGVRDGRRSKDSG